MFVRDVAGDVLKLFIYVVTGAVARLRQALPAERGLFKGEFYALVLFALLGMMLMVSAGSLVMVYLGLELLALCQYALVAMDRDNPLASEAAMKYFVLGSLASGMLLYGMSMVYGATGSAGPRRSIHAATGGGSARHCCSTGLVFIVVGHRLQVRRRAIPHVAAGRLPRRADADHAVHRLGAEARRVRHGLPPAGNRRRPARRASGA